MNDNHTTGANHIPEVMHGVINDKTKLGKFPNKLFVQVNNCMNEKKNKYNLVYFECLKQCGVVDEIKSGFCQSMTRTVT